MPEVKLRECPLPWCANDDASVCRWEDDEFWVRCGCGAYGPTRATEAEAIAAWNSRPGEDKLIAALKDVASTLSIYRSKRTDKTHQCNKDCNCDRCAARKLIRAALRERGIEA